MKSSIVEFENKEKYEIPSSTVIELFTEAPILTTSDEQVPDPWPGGDWEI